MIVTLVHHIAVCPEFTEVGPSDFRENTKWMIAQTEIGMTDVQRCSVRHTGSAPGDETRRYSLISRVSITKGLEEMSLFQERAKVEIEDDPEREDAMRVCRDRIGEEKEAGEEIEWMSAPSEGTGG